MKYLVVYAIEQNEQAYVFDSYNDAINYVEQCMMMSQGILSDVAKRNGGGIDVVFLNGERGKIDIIECEADKLRFDLLYMGELHKKESRRYSRRDLAIDRAHELLAEYGCVAGPKDDANGDWVVYDESGSKRVFQMKLTAVVLDDVASGEEYSILGVAPDASIDAIKTAYRKLAKENHPDKGGDAKKFEQIQKAYNRLKNGEVLATKKAIVREYDLVDMRVFFTDFMLSGKDDAMRLGIPYFKNSAKPTKPSGIALLKFWCGVLSMIIGIGLILMNGMLGSLWVYIVSGVFIAVGVIFAIPTMLEK